MYGDSLNDFNIITQKNNKLIQKRSPLWASFLTGENGESLVEEAVDKNRLVTSQALIVTERMRSGELDNLVRGKPNGSQDTEIKHVKSVKQNFKFNNYPKLIQFNRSKSDVMGDDESMHVQTLNRLGIIYDRATYLGTQTDMEDAENNIGYFDNGNNQNWSAYGNGATTTINSVGDLTSLMTAMSMQVQSNTAIDDPMLIRFVLTGAKITTFLGGVTGGFVRSNNAIVEDIFGQRWTKNDKNGLWTILAPQVVSVDRVSCFATPLVSVHTNGIPEIYQLGENSEKLYDFTHYIYGSVGVNVVELGSAITAEVDVTAPLN